MDSPYVEKYNEKKLAINTQDESQRNKCKLIYMNCVFSENTFVLKLWLLVNVPTYDNFLFCLEKIVSFVNHSLHI